MQLTDHTVDRLQEVDATDIDSLVADLASDRRVTRICARERLIEIGSRAVPSLINALDDREAHVRWEAAKTLGEIADPVAASSLVAHLEDKNVDLRWVAAMALVKLGPAVLPSLARALLEQDDAQWLREGAHRVCHYLKKKHSDELAAALLSALDTREPELTVPGVAYEILKRRSLT
jgi:HEAT repeat protein